MSSDVYLYKSDGTLIIGPLDIECPLQELPILIGVVDVYDDPSSGVPAPYDMGNGFVPDFPTLDEFQEFGCFNFDYSCDLTTSSGLSITEPFETLACGAVYAYVEPSTAFTVEGVTAYLEVPSALFSVSHVLRVKWSSTYMCRH